MRLTGIPQGHCKLLQLPQALRAANAFAQTLIQERYDLVEEGRNAGKTLKEIGDEHKLKFVDVEAVDSSNKTPDGKTGLDIPDAEIALKQVFGTAVGTQPDAVELPGSAYVWFDVQSVTERKQKPLEDVKADVKAAYIEAETAKQLDELAQKLVDRLKAGEAFAKVAEDELRSGAPINVEQIADLGVAIEEVRSFIARMLSNEPA